MLVLRNDRRAPERDEGAPFDAHGRSVPGQPQTQICLHLYKSYVFVRILFIAPSINNFKKFQGPKSSIYQPSFAKQMEAAKSGELTEGNANAPAKVGKAVGKGAKEPAAKKKAESKKKKAGDDEEPIDLSEKSGSGGDSE